MEQIEYIEKIFLANMDWKLIEVEIKKVKSKGYIVAGCVPIYDRREFYVAGKNHKSRKMTNEWLDSIKYTFRRKNEEN